MIHVICTVFDVKSGIFHPPMFLPARGAALRSFMDEINREHPDNLLWKHADDFHLYQLGLFDDNDCSFDLIAKPHLLLTGSDAKKKPE